MNLFSYLLAFGISLVSPKHALIKVAPAHMQPYAMMKTLATEEQSGPTTFYIRPDGGSAHTAAFPQGTCDGKTDAPAAGATGFHCAFNAWQWMYDGPTSVDWGWKIVSGDLVVTETGMHMASGAGNIPGGLGTWSCNGQTAKNCINPTVPAGTSSAPTRLWSRCALTSCSVLGPPFNRQVTDHSKLTELEGFGGVYAVLNLGATNYIDVRGFNITRRGTCAVQGFLSDGSSCNENPPPLSAYDGDGIDLYLSRGITLTDVWLHGNTGFGLKGSFLGTLSMLRVNAGYNAQGGLNFDDHQGITGTGNNFIFQDGIIEGNGCYQEYPIVDQNAMLQCHGDQESPKGYGDGMGSAHQDDQDVPGQYFNVTIDHSILRYNVQDGEDFGPVVEGNVNFTFTNNLSYGNGGAQVKWGNGFSTFNMSGNLLGANCTRLVDDGLYHSVKNYRIQLQRGELCRSDAIISMSVNTNTVGVFSNNTITGYGGVLLSHQCFIGAAAGQSNCDAATVHWFNNVVRWYSWNYQGGTNDPYGGGNGPGFFCGGTCGNHNDGYYNGNDGGNSGVWTRDHNVYYGGKACFANQPSGDVYTGSTQTNEYCEDPGFLPDIAAQTYLTTGAELDVYDNASAYALNTNSGHAYHGGATPVSGYTVDLLGNPINSSTPDMGGLAYSTKTATTTTVTPSASSGAFASPVTLTANVSPASAGTVVFSTGGGASLGSATVSSGVATLTTTFPYASAHYIRASFVPSGSLQPSYGETSYTSTASTNSVTLSISSASVALNGHATITLIAHQSDGLDQDVSSSATYTSNPTGIVTVSGNTLTAVGAGTTTLTGSYGGQNSSLTVSVISGFDTSGFTTVNFSSGLGGFTADEGTFGTSTGSTSACDNICLFNGSNGNNFYRYISSFTADQGSCLKISQNDANYIGFGVRSSSSLDGYAVLVQNSSAQMTRMTSGHGSGINLGSAFTVNVNDVACITAVGSTVTMYINGVNKSSVTDTTYSGTNTEPFIFGYQYGNAASTTFQAGSIGSAPTLTSVSAAPASFSITVGGTDQSISTTATYSDNSTNTVAGTCTSNNTNVVTVSGCVAHAIAAGTTTITDAYSTATPVSINVTVNSAVVPTPRKRNGRYGGNTKIN